MSLLALSCFLTAATALAVPPPAVDYNFGAYQAVWKQDGSALALQDEHGIAIRDGQTLKLKRYLPLEIKEGWPLLRAWNGDDLFLESKSRSGDGERSLPSRATIISVSGKKTRAVWEHAEFSVNGDVLWFHKADKLRVLSLKTRRWFDARLPFRTEFGDEDNWGVNFTFSPDGRFAADQLGDGRLRLWNVKTRKVTAILKDKVSSSAYPQAMAPAIWSPNGTLVATLGEDPSHEDFSYEEGPNDGSQNNHPPVVKIWDARTGQLVHWFASVGAPVRWRDENTLEMTGDNGDTVETFGAGLQIYQVSAHRSSFVRAQTPLALSPQGNRLFAGYQVLELGAHNKARVVKAMFAAPPAVGRLSWSRDGHFVASTYSGPEQSSSQYISGVQVWNARNLTLEFAAPLHRGAQNLGWTNANQLWSSNSISLSTWSADNSWAQTNWQVPPVNKEDVEFGRRNDFGLFLLPDGARTVEVSGGSKGAIYERANPSAPAQLLFKNAPRESSSEILSPDGKWLCLRALFPLTSDAENLQVYELQAGGRSLVIEGKSNSDNEFPCFSSDARWAYWDERLFSLPSWQVASELGHFQKGVTYAIAPDARTFLRIEKGALRVVDQQNTALKTLIPSNGNINDAQFSPDGSQVAVTRGANLQIYDAATGNLLATLYAWPRRTPAPGADWLALRPGAKATGTSAALAQVVSAGRK